MYSKVCNFTFRNIIQYIILQIDEKSKKTLILCFAQTTTQIVSCICNILYFTDNSPLSLKEIISNHTVEPSVQVNCNHLCYKEPKCVGFNFRTKTDEKQPVNCQLTNTTRRKTNKRPGDWTLFYDVDAVCIFEMFVLSF